MGHFIVRIVRSLVKSPIVAISCPHFGFEPNILLAMQCTKKLMRTYFSFRFQISQTVENYEEKRNTQRKYDATATYSAYKSNATSSNRAPHSKYATTTTATAATPAPYEYVSGSAAAQSYDAVT